MESFAGEHTGRDQASLKIRSRKRGELGLILIVGVLATLSREAMRSENKQMA